MKHVLIVDDATTVRLYHRKILASAGWQVEEASNGMEALEKVMKQSAAEPFDLYVVDVNMPRMDGYSFVRELRRMAPPPPQAPVLMVSTESQARDATSGHEAGANSYLVKPVKSKELLLTAALLLGDREVAEQAAAGLEEARP